MKSETPLKLLAGVNLLVGLLWLAGLLVLPLISKLLSGRFEFGWSMVFTAALAIWLCLPGGFALFAGWRLWQQVDRSTIKFAVGTLMTCAGLFAVFQVSHLGETYHTLWDLFAAMCFGVPLYVGLSKLLMRRAEIQPVRGEFFGKGTLQLAAFFLWISLMNWAPELENSFAEQGSGLELLCFLGVLLLPYVLYRVAVRCWVRDPYAEIARIDYPPRGGVTDLPVK